MEGKVLDGTPVELWDYTNKIITLHKKYKNLLYISQILSKLQLTLIMIYPLGFSFSTMIKQE